MARRETSKTVGKRVKIRRGRGNREKRKVYGERGGGADRYEEQDEKQRGGCTVDGCKLVERDLVVDEWINPKTMRRRGPGCGCVWINPKRRRRRGRTADGYRERERIVDLLINSKRSRKRGTGWL